MEFEKLSVDELKALAAGKSPTAPVQSKEVSDGPDLSHLSPHTLSRIAMGEQVSNEELQPPKGIGEQVLDGVVKVGKFVDSYTGAPTRAGISAAIKGENPLTAYGKQFGENPDLAPTGKDIARQAGVSSKPLVQLDPGTTERLTNVPMTSPRDGAGAWLGSKIASIPRDAAVGAGIDLAADPTNIIGAGAIMKGAGRGTVAAAKGVGRIAAAQVAEKAPAAVKAAEIAKAATNSAVESLAKVFSPRRADDYDDLVQIATKNGIDPKMLPESIEFGPDSFITRASRSKAEGVLGQKKLEDFREGLSQVQGAIDNKISAVSQGRPVTAVDAGQAIRSGFDDALSRTLDEDAITYRSVQKYAPGLRINRGEMERLNSAINGVEKFARGQVMRGIRATDREQGKQLLNAVAAMRRSNGSFKQAVESLDMIGKAAFSSTRAGNDIPVDIEKMQKLYFDYREAIINTVKKDVSPEFAAELVANNKKMSELFGDQSLVSRVVANPSIAPESVFQSVVMSGDTQKIAALKRILPPETIQHVKGAVLENLIKRDADGAFNFKTLHSAMRNKRTVLEALFEPQELADFGELVRLGDRFGTPIMSTSGTGASNVFKDVIQSVKNGVANDAVLETMKERARTGTKAVQKSSDIVSPVLVPPSRPSMRIPRRGKIERGAKGAQVLSIQHGSPRSIASDEEQNK